MNEINLPTSQVTNNTKTITSNDLKFISKLVHWEDNIVGTYLGIICIIALCLNFLVFYTCLKNWKSLMMSDFYILNLACSDTLLPMSAFPLPISSSFFHRWMFTETGCVVYGFLGFFFGIVSITTLTIMGLTRYVSICHPQINITSAKFTKNTIIFPYIYALIWSSIPLSGWGSYSVESYGTSCTLQWNDNKVFITLMSVFCISTPSAVMFFSYTMILLKCRKSNRNIRGWQARNAKMSRKESYLIKITFAMCWGFLICWMPYAIVSMWTAYGDATYLPLRLTVVAVLLAKTSTVVNPVIYFLMSNKFRPLLMRSLNLDGGQQRQIKETRNMNGKIEKIPVQRMSKCSNTGSCSNTSSDMSTSGAKLYRHVVTMKLSVSSEDVAL